MDYKTIMVSLALDRPNHACLAVAGDFAERFGARVIGIAASDLRLPLYFAEGGYAQKLLDDEAAAIGKRLPELEVEFRAGVEKRAKSLEWRSTQAMPVPYILQQARAADVLVVGARSETIVGPCAAADPSDLLMQAGRPVIVVPLRSNGSISEACWWPGSICGKPAGPYSMRCRSSPGHRMSRSWKFPSRAPIAPMRRHMLRTWRRGWAATASSRAPSFRNLEPVPEQLDRIAADVGAGAVIAGAHGHSRFREWILSGVTRHLATESRRCAFLSR